MSSFYGSTGRAESRILLDIAPGRIDTDRDKVRVSDRLFRPVARG